MPTYGRMRPRVAHTTRFVKPHPTTRGGGAPTRMRVGAAGTMVPAVNAFRIGP